MSRLLVAVTALTATVLMLSVLVPAASCLPRQTIAPFAFTDPSVALALDQHDDDAKAEGDESAGSGAVVLLHEQRFLFQRLAESSSLVHSEIFTHEVIKLETEAGFEHARVQMGWPRNGTLVSLDARTIAADGTVTALQQSELFASEVKLDKELNIDARMFEFPHVEVGSIIELAYKIDLPGLYTSWNERIPEELPIRRYTVDVAVDGVAQPAMRLMNTEVQPVESVDAAGMKHVSFELRDVAPRSSERFAPSWRSREPWWLYHTVLYKYRPNEIWYVHYDWEDEVKNLGKDKKTNALDGAPDIDVSRCGADYGCVLKAALDKTNQLTVFEDFDAFAFRHRSVAEIIASGKASAGDKAFLFQVILHKAGVDARLAGVARVGSERVHKEFPSLLWLDHTIVVSIFGDNAVWVDPSCESCRPGYLPPWDPVASAADGDTVKETLVVTGVDDPRPHWWSLIAPLENTVGDGEVRSFTLSVGNDGSAKIAEDIVRTGLGASLWRGDTVGEDDDDARHEAYVGLREFAHGAVIDKATLVTCDAARSRCQRHVEATLPKYAWRADGEVAVPLDILGSTWRIDDDRKNDIVRTETWKSRTEVKVVAPAGMKLVSMPHARQAHAGIVDIETTSTSADAATITSEVRLKPGRVVRKDLAALAHALDLGASAAAGVVRFRATEVTSTTSSQPAP